MDYMYSVGTPPLEEIRDILLEFVQRGEAYVSAREVRDGKRVFLHSSFSTAEDKAFTIEWLKDPHFEVQ